MITVKQSLSANTISTLQQSEIDNLFTEALAIVKGASSNKNQDYSAEFNQIGDNFGRILFYAIGKNDSALLDKTIEAMLTCWKVGDIYEMHHSGGPGKFETDLWRSIIHNVWAAGAYSISQNNWAAARALSLPIGLQKDNYAQYWLRQGQVVDSRTSSRRGEDETKFLEQIALQVSKLEPSMDTTQSLYFASQFDLFSAMVISEEPTEKTSDSPDFFPNTIYKSDVPVVDLIVEHLRHIDSQARQHVFVQDDEGLRNALSTYANACDSQTVGRNNPQDDMYVDAFITTGKVI